MKGGLGIAGAAGRQLSSGVVVGLSAVIYSLSYGALLFSGPLAPAVGFGITVALISAAIGALFGALSEDRAFIAGPDSNTVSVLASIVATSGASAAANGVAVAVAIAVLTSLLSAAAFYAVARADLSGLVRYIPFPVMAGFLTSTGWLMASGATNIIAGMPFSRAGLDRFLADPFRPELGFGLLVVACLYGLGRVVPGALLIPLVMGLAALVVNLVLASGLCTAAACRPELWLFPKVGEVAWLPPWHVGWGALDLGTLAASLPGMLVVSFVGLLTILLSVASLELGAKREFDLNGVLKAHALTGGVAALLGGFMPLISIGRTAVSRQTGGGLASGAIASAICLAMLLGAGDLIGYMPKAALGALVLFLGLNLMKQWLWDNRASTPPLELAQILLILGLVANFGFVVGFTAGVLFSCASFIVTYSRIPLTSLAADVAVVASSVVRPAHEADLLRRHGGEVRVYRLNGYVFFGSASKIADVFRTIKTTGEGAVQGVVLDFTNVSGIDSSAIGVFRRIIGRFGAGPMRFYLVHSPATVASLGRIDPAAVRDGRIRLFPDLDRAIECAEEEVIARWQVGEGEAPAFAALDDDASRDLFRRHCEMRRVRQGELLCAERDQSDALFFLEDGGLEVVKTLDGGAQVRLAKLHQGTMVGELAFYTGEARSASIVAAVDSQVLVLSRQAFARMRDTDPDLAMRFDHAVIRKISAALARTSKLATMYR